MEDMQGAEQIDAAGETDLLDMVLDGCYEELLATVDAECDRTDRKNLPSSAAIPAIAAAQLARPDDAIEWLTRGPTSALTRADQPNIVIWAAEHAMSVLSGYACAATGSSVSWRISPDMSTMHQ